MLISIFKGITNIDTYNTIFETEFPFSVVNLVIQDSNTMSTNERLRMETPISFCR